MFQVVRKPVYNRVFTIILAVFRISHGDVTRCPAFVLVFLPKELQRHARTFQFLMDIFVIRFVIQVFQGKLVRIKTCGKPHPHLSGRCPHRICPSYQRCGTHHRQSSLKCACWWRLHSGPVKLQYQLHVNLLSHVFGLLS